jgi:hypothetical protein
VEHELLDRTSPAAGAVRLFSYDTPGADTTTRHRRAGVRHQQR